MRLKIEYKTYKEIIQQPDMWLKEYDLIYKNRKNIETFLTHQHISPESEIIFTGAGTSAFIGDILSFLLPQKGYSNAKAGKKTGISVVCRLNDATPASFVAHQTDRDQAEDIVNQFSGCDIDFIAGGGMKYWRNRPDNKDMVEVMKNEGYTVAENVDELRAVNKLPALAILADLELPVASIRGNLFRDMNQKAIELLNVKNKNGFFLMIEGSCIDDWSHANKTDKVMEEVLDLDRVIGDVLQWAEKDSETLVIVAADHETGGLSLLDGDIEKGIVKVNFANQSHSNVLVPVFAFGPGAEMFSGNYENTELGQKIMNIIVEYKNR